MLMAGTGWYSMLASPDFNVGRVMVYFVVTIASLSLNIWTAAGLQLGASLTTRLLAASDGRATSAVRVRECEGERSCVVSCSLCSVHVYHFAL